MPKLIISQILYNTRKFQKKNLFRECKRKALMETTKKMEKLCFVIPREEGKVILYVYEYE
jgi:hypothetical protein